MFNGNSEVYKRIKRQYLDYVKLYQFFNYGSAQGIIPFDQFYWRMIYRINYVDASKVGTFH